MTATNFDRQIQSAQDRLQTMQIRANSSSTSSKALQDEAIAEFSITLEELHVATEELQTQNEELLTSRQTLELERQQYQELFDFAPDGYLVTNTQGVIQQANCAATKMLNLRQDLMVGKPLIVFVDKADQTDFHTQLEQLIHHGQSLTDWEVSLKPREKPSFPVSISVSTMYYDPQGHLMGFRWLMRDLSQRKQHEQEIREQANLLNVATDAILVRSLENQILFWNQGAERLYGWTAAEALGKNITELLYPESLPQIEEIQNVQVIQDGEWRGELEQITQSNQAVIVESHWTLVRDEEGRPKSILVVNTDITAKTQLELQFLRVQRLESLGILASGIAHDMNNILTPMLASAQLLPILLPPLDEQSQQLLTVFEDNARRGAELVKQILTFARGGEGEWIAVQVKHLLVELEQITQSTFPKSIEITHNFPTQDLWMVSANATQLHQVFMNLFVNARDAMPQGGILGIKAENFVIDAPFAQLHLEAQVGPYIAITVSDTGSGMSPKVEEHIFEPFFTTKDMGQGTGLGLSTVLGIVKSHGGFVEVHSQVGTGSQFKIYLPAIEAIEAPLVDELDLPRGQGEFILVVDDEALIRKITKLLLEKSGYQVLTAPDGIEAISLYRQHQDKISVVIMDMMMPFMDGQAAIFSLKGINAQVKIIANSGLSLSPQFSLEVGANIKAFLLKPYTLELLLTTLHEVISHSSEAI